MTAATTILQQLGGNRFLAMTGAKSLLNGGNYLQMDVKGKGSNKLRVTLDPSDTYTVETFKYSRKTLECASVAKREGVYGDNLRDIFTNLTGLYTSL